MLSIQCTFSHLFEWSGPGLLNFSHIPPFLSPLLLVTTMSQRHHCNTLLTALLLDYTLLTHASPGQNQWWLQSFLLCIDLCIYFWLHGVFAAAHRLFLVATSGGYSLVAAHRLLIAVPWLLLLQSTGSRHSGLVAAVLRLSRSTARGILVLRPGTEPALAGGFLTTGPPGKSQNFYECGLGGMT